MKLLTPGPSDAHPQVLKKLSLPLIHHRSEYFKLVYASIIAQMRLIVKSKDAEIIVLNGSGSYGMEASLLNLFQTKEEILLINNGYFASRFKDMGEMQGLIVHELVYENNVFKSDDIEVQLKRYPNIKAIVATHSETSTGLLQDLVELGRICKLHDLLLVVDSISGIIMNPVNFDASHIDCLIMASQKGFLMPPGLAMIALSKRAMKKILTVPKRSYIFDFEMILEKFYDDERINNTPSIPLYLGLHEALCILNQHPIQVWNEYYARIHQTLAFILEDCNFEILNNENPSQSILVCRSEYSAISIREYLEDRYDIRIELGLNDQSDRILRIGCMNNIMEEELETFHRCLKQTLQAIKHEV